jgi:Tfp pilus assembly protein PilN
MPFINLIQEHVLAAKKERKRARVALLCFTFATSLAVAANGYCIWQSESLDADISKLQADTNKNKGMLAKIEENRHQLNDLSPRLKTLSDAQDMTQRWASILDHLSKQTPPGAWLTGLVTQSTDPTKPLSTSFKGISTRQELVGEFMLRLQTCAELENVSLRFTGEKIISSNKGIEFDVTADIAGTATEKPKNEQKEGAKG